MVYTENTKKAMNIAYKAHYGQIDKSGVPYIFHPLHLAEQMQTEDECIVALLHDVVEDTYVKFEDLRKEGFSEDIIQAVKLLTHDNSIDYDEYMDYIKKIKQNPLAKKIKIADIDHNSDITRLGIVTEKDEKRCEKYRVAKKILTSE